MYFFLERSSSLNHFVRESVNAHTLKKKHFVLQHLTIIKSVTQKKLKYFLI